jgi:hypothetical protein
MRLYLPICYTVPGWQKQLGEGQLGGDVVDWLALFEQENVRFVVLDRCTDSDLIERLRRGCLWIVDFENKELVIFMRRSR